MDSILREAERLAHNGDPEQQERYYRLRLRQGSIRRDHIHLAALMGDEAAARIIDYRGPLFKIELIVTRYWSHWGFDGAVRTEWKKAIRSIGKGPCVRVCLATLQYVTLLENDIKTELAEHLGKRDKDKNYKPRYQHNILRDVRWAEFWGARPQVRDSIDLINLYKGLMGWGDTFWKDTLCVLEMLCKYSPCRDYSVRFPAIEAAAKNACLDWIKE